MASIVVGIGDCRVSRNKEDQLITFALGSCVAVIAYDPVASTGGMLHFLLPRGPEYRPHESIFRYGDTGIVALIEALKRQGASPSRLTVVLAGGACMFRSDPKFDVGRQNIDCARSVLSQLRLSIAREDIGGTISRTVRLDMETGNCWTKSISDQSDGYGSERLSWRMIDSPALL
jgi:chemotaxis protein CheD